MKKSVLITIVIVVVFSLLYLYECESKPEPQEQSITHQLESKEHWKEKIFILVKN